MSENPSYVNIEELDLNLFPTEKKYSSHYTFKFKTNIWFVKNINKKIEKEKRIRAFDYFRRGQSLRYSLLYLTLLRELEYMIGGPLQIKL